MAAHDKAIKKFYKRHPMSGVQAIIFAQKRRRLRKVRSASVAVLTAIAVLVGGIGAGYFWFTSSLDDALNRNADEGALQSLVKANVDEPFYVLVLASDSRTVEHNPGAAQQTDVMMLVRIDAKKKIVTLLSIPRDTRYTLPNGEVVKMNEVYALGGLKQTIEAISSLTGLPISHYAMVYMSDLKNVVDTVGGVVVNVDAEVNNNDPETEENVNIQPGEQTLDGKHAQAYAISRHDVETSQDEHRQMKIRTLLSAIISKILDRSVTKIPGVVIDLAQYVSTDMHADELVQLGIDFATGSNAVTIYQGSGPSDGDIDPATGMWLCYENPAGWAEVVSVVDAGNDPSTVSY